jgi:hypothetical protein
LADAMSVLSVKHPCTTALRIKKKIFHEKIVDAAEALYDVKLQASMPMAVRAKFVVECVEGVNRKHGIPAHVWSTPTFAKPFPNPYETAPAALRHPEVSHHAPLLHPLCVPAMFGRCLRASAACSRPALLAVSI